MAITRAEVALGVNTRGLRTGLARAQRISARSFKTMGAQAARSMRSALGSVASIAGGVGFAALGKEAFDFEKRLTRLQIQSGASGREMLQFRTNMSKISSEMGISKVELSKVATELVNLEGAAGFSVKKMQTLAKASKATGAPIDALAGLSLTLGTAFGVKEDGLEQSLSSILEAGKAGSIPLEKMNSTLQKVGATFAQFGATGGRDGVAQLASTMQTLRANGFSSAEEAGTGLTALVTAFTKNSKKLEGAGVKIFDEGPDGIKRMRDMGSILDDMARSKLVKDPALMTKALGRVEATKAARALLGNRDSLEAMTKAASKSNAVQEDFDKFQESSAGRMEKALSRAKDKMLSIFTPERIDKFAAAMEKVASAIEFAVDHAESLAILFGAAKLSQMASGIGGIARQLGGVGTSAAGAAGQIGKMAGALNVMAAFSGGVAIGSAIDKAYGKDIGRFLRGGELAEETGSRREQQGQFFNRIENIEALNKRLTFTADTGKRQELAEGIARNQQFLMDALKNSGAFDEETRTLKGLKGDHNRAVDALNLRVTVDFDDSTGKLFAHKQTQDSRRAPK